MCLPTTPTSTVTTFAKRTKTVSSTSSDGKWKTFHSHAGLMQYVPSGMFFARAKVNGIVKRASIETDVLTTAKDRLRLKINELREPPAELGTFEQAKRLYLADEMKRYWNYRVVALLKSWPGLDKMSLSEITEAESRAWDKRFSERFEAVNFNNTLGAFRNILKRGGLGHDKNPAMSLKRLGARPKQMTLPEPEQFDAIVKTVETAGARQSKDCADLIRFLAPASHPGNSRPQHRQREGATRETARFRDETKPRAPRGQRLLDEKNFIPRFFARYRKTFLRQPDGRQGIRPLPHGRPRDRHQLNFKLGHYQIVSTIRTSCSLNKFCISNSVC